MKNQSLKRKHSDDLEDAPVAKRTPARCSNSTIIVNDGNLSVTSSTPILKEGSLKTPKFGKTPKSGKKNVKNKVLSPIKNFNLGSSPKKNTTKTEINSVSLVSGKSGENNSTSLYLTADDTVASSKSILTARDDSIDSSTLLSATSALSTLTNSVVKIKKNKSKILEKSVNVKDDNTTDQLNRKSNDVTGSLASTEINKSISKSLLSSSKKKNKKLSDESVNLSNTGKKLNGSAIKTKLSPVKKEKKIGNAMNVSISNAVEQKKSNDISKNGKLSKKLKKTNKTKNDDLINSNNEQGELALNDKKIPNSKLEKISKKKKAVKKVSKGNKKSDAIGDILQDSSVSLKPIKDKNLEKLLLEQRTVEEKKVKERDQDSMEIDDDVAVTGQVVVNKRNRKRRARAARAAFTRRQNRIAMESDASPSKAVVEKLEKKKKSLKETPDASADVSSKDTNEDQVMKDVLPADDSTSTYAPLPNKQRKANKLQKIEERKSKTLPAKHEDSEKKTIFIGNIPVATNRKELSKFFSQYGVVDTVRIRGVSAADENTSKKMAILTNKLHPSRHTFYAYLRFKEEESVTAALAANGTVFKDLHIRVDKASSEDHSAKGLSIFIGNLAFDIEEEVLYKHFVKCGDIESVRVIRNKDLGSGKGIAYINFKTKDAVEIALLEDGARLLHRPMRVNRAINKKNKKEKELRKLNKIKKLKAGPGVSKTAQAEAAQSKMSLKFMKKSNSKSEGEEGGGGGPFAGLKTAEHGKIKKFKKNKISLEDKKKFDMAHKLYGDNKFAKASYKDKIKAKKTHIVFD